jgi:hypothetical protein
LILKNDKIRDRERKRETESLLGSMGDEKFAQLVNLGKKITDWSNEQIMSGGGNQFGVGNNRNEDDEMDETIGVNVMIGDDEDDEDGDETGGGGGGGGGGRGGGDLNEIDDDVDEEGDEDQEIVTANQDTNGTTSGGGGGANQQVIRGKVRN